MATGLKERSDHLKADLKDDSRVSQIAPAMVRTTVTRKERQTDGLKEPPKEAPTLPVTVASWDYPMVALMDPPMGTRTAFLKDSKMAIDLEAPLVRSLATLTARPKERPKAHQTEYSTDPSMVS